MGDAYLSLVLREPMGVAALLTPWNAPLSVATMRADARSASGGGCDQLHGRDGDRTQGHDSASSTLKRLGTEEDQSAVATALDAQGDELSRSVARMMFEQLERG